MHPVLIPFANSLRASSKKKRLGGKHIKTVDNAVLPSEQKLCYLGNVLSWRGTTAAHKPGQPRGDECSVSGMKATSDFTQKQMSTTQLSLLFCMPEKTGQFIAVMASVLVNSSRTASKSWLVRKGMMRSPQLRSCSIAKSSDTLQKVWSTCQLTASSKPLLMAY